MVLALPSEQTSCLQSQHREVQTSPSSKGGSHWQNSHSKNQSLACHFEGCQPFFLFTCALCPNNNFNCTLFASISDLRRAQPSQRQQQMDSKPKIQQACERSFNLLVYSSLFAHFLKWSPKKPQTDDSLCCLVRTITFPSAK